MQRIDEAAERQPAFHLVAPREVGDVQHVGQHLLAAAPQDEAGVRAGHRDEAAERVGDGPVIARRMQLAQRAERLCSRLEVIGQVVGNSVRMKTPALRARVIFEQLFFADRKERTVQRRIHRQLVFRPFDGGQRGSNRIHFFALVKRLAANQQVRHAARLERLDVVTRHVVSEMQEAAEQEADVAGGNSSALLLHT